MKKILLWIWLMTSTLILSGCWGKTEDTTTVIDIENAEVNTGDVEDFNTVVWWSRYSEKEWEISLFTFKGDNTFAVSVGDKEARGPWIVSEGRILLGESQLPLEIIAENEITIDGVQYLRNPEIN